MKQLKEDMLKTLIIFCCVLGPIVLFLNACAHQDKTDWVGITKYIKDQK